MSYTKINVPLSEGQLNSLRSAVNAGRGITLRIGANQGGRPFPLLLTKTQINHLAKTRRSGHGADLKLSKSQITAMRKDGGFFPLLAAIPGLIAAAAPTIAAAAPAALAALGTGALSGAAGYGVNRALQAISGKGLRLKPYRGGNVQRPKKSTKKNKSAN